MSDRVVYAQCGLRLRSEVPLDLPVVSGESWDTDVVRGGDVETAVDDPPGELVAERRLADGAGWWYRATEADGGYLLRFHDSGDVLVSSDLTRVEVRGARTGRAELLPVLLAGTVSAFLLGLRGATVLHHEPRSRSMARRSRSWDLPAAARRRWRRSCASTGRRWSPTTC